MLKFKVLGPFLLNLILGTNAKLSASPGDERGSSDRL